MIILKKLLGSIISALIGLILIPILAFDFSIDKSPILIIFFLPGFCIGLIILFELINTFRIFNAAYGFIQGQKMIILFFTLLILEWIIIWLVNPMNDIVFASQFATVIIPAIMVYNWLGKRWNLY